MSTCGGGVVVVVSKAKWLTVANPLWILPDLNHLNLWQLRFICAL